ncbi:hypothetical protein IAU60_003453 [Kwoniella sp. DSM 27419]
MSEEKHPESVPALLSSLRHLQETNPKAVRANVHLYPASIYANDVEASSSQLRDRKITSWKMTEHMYFNASNPFPTLARGLFTEAVEEGDPLPDEVYNSAAEGSRPKDRIVARGYDKFFNTDEMEWTSWAAMKVHTEPPYHLTLKSNGCLILISALSPTHLLVASKHSLGTATETLDQAKDNGLADAVGSLALTQKGKESGKLDKTAEKEEHAEAKAHAAVGREWVKRTLQASGKREADLAKRLWDGNMTAVLELCDDSFEEHVIATPDYWTGLHLHGLNHNTPHFSTSTPDEVSDFAKEFGFIETKHVKLNTLDEVKSFTDDIAKTGSWQGDMIEGFVVRCQVKHISAANGTERDNGKPPYRPGAPFFFKVKFDEPYLLYRQWREITRVMLPLMDETDPDKLAAIWKKVRTKTKRPEVGVYADWAGKMLKSEPGLFANYDKGVVRVRERFLTWTEGEGKKVWDEARSGMHRKVAGSAQVPRNKEGLPKKWLLVPIAVPGCGKTLIGVALSKLTGCGHTQSDDVTTKKTAPTFIKNITSLLQKQDIVYADRNNHIVKHYDELAAIAESKQMKDYNLRLIGIAWDISSQPYHRLLRICSERVVDRGDNHQTLRPDLTVDAEHEAVVGQFLRNFTSPDPALFDQLLEVRVADTPREVLGKIIDGLVDVVGIARPTDADIVAALQAGSTYKPVTPYHAIGRVGKATRYFGLAPEIDLAEVVGSALAPLPKNDVTSSAHAFLEALKEKSRVTAKPHVTLSHEKNVQAEKEALAAAEGLESSTQPGPQSVLWDTCKALAEAKYSTLFEYDLTHLIWDDRIMTLALANMRPSSGVATDKGVPDLDSVLPEEVRSVLHVTVGTVSEEVAPYESRGLMRLLTENVASGREEGQADEVVEGGGQVKWVKIGPIKGEGRVRGMY